MKLNARDGRAFFSKPDKTKAGVLIFGPDAMRISLRRKELIDTLTGPNADEEMRLARISASDLRKDGAMLGDAIKAQGFFPGPRVAFVEDAADGLTKTIVAALDDWQQGDATILVTAGQLPPRSTLRKAFESRRDTAAIAIYADPPGRDEIEAELSKAKVSVAPNAMTDLMDLGRVLDPGDFRQVVEKLSLYKINDPEPATSEDIANCAPVTTEAALDDALDIVAEGRVHELGPILQKLDAQGIAAVRLCIGANQHFRKLYAAACDPGGPEAGIAKARPPVPYMRKDRLIRQAKGWGVHKLEAALGVLTETDLTLRSARPVPQMALMERALIRLAMMGRR
ncbi:MAG: DNA polymerase III subunit delta [Litoreibacter sp.]